MNYERDDMDELSRDSSQWVEQAEANVYEAMHESLKGGATPDMVLVQCGYMTDGIDRVVPGCDSLFEAIDAARLALGTKQASRMVVDAINEHFFA